MKTREDLLQKLRDEFLSLKEKFKIKKMGLFGSCARGTQTKKSDIDILVEFENPVGFFKFIELETYLSLKLGIKVDLVTPDALKPLIKPQIMKEAIYV